MVVTILIVLNTSIVYWPTTQPGCQNRKCTYVNSRCIQSRNNQDIIALTMDRLNEYKIVTPTRRRWALNYYITQCTGNSISWRQAAVEEASTQQREPSGSWLISLEIRPVGEKMLDRGTCPREAGPQAPGWAA